MQMFDVESLQKSCFFISESVYLEFNFIGQWTFQGHNFCQKKKVDQKIPSKNQADKTHDPKKHDYTYLLLEPSCCKKRQKSPKQETNMGNRGSLKFLKDTKLILND